MGYSSPLHLSTLKFTNVCQSRQPANQSEVFREYDETAQLYFLQIKAPVFASADFTTAVHCAELLQAKIPCK